MIDEAAGVLAPLGFSVAERGELVVPCPLVSRGRPIYSSDAAASRAAPSGGAPPSGAPSSGAPSSGGSIAVGDEAPWVAVHAGVGPEKMLVNWAALAGIPGEGLAAAPSAYVIETSASSTNGRDGEWRRELSVDQNTACARAHVIEFDGQSWVRLTLSGEAGGAALPFERLDLHDASDGTDDCWLVLGDACLAALEEPGRGTPGAGERGWAGLIHQRYPGYFPALIDEAHVDEAPAHTLERLAALLEMHSPAKRVAIAYGADSFRSMVADTQALEAIVAAVLRDGRLPVLARPPAPRGRAREGVDALQRQIAAIEQRHRLVPGPDLMAWFNAHPDQLDAEGRPTLEGRRAIARLWADAVDVWYVPQ